MDNLNDLAYFVAVVDHGGFSAAARATGLEKTRLSRRIAALESRLGVRLLQRSTRRIALTEAESVSSSRRGHWSKARRVSTTAWPIFGASRQARSG